MTRLRHFASSFLSIELGDNSRRLARGIAAIGPFFIAARGLTAVGQILAGRWLGSMEFGLATMVIAVASTMLVPLQLGFMGAVVKFTPLAKDPSGQAAFISTSLWLQTLWGAVCLVLLFLARKYLGHVLHVEPAVYSWALAYAGLWTAFTFLSTALQGVMHFRERGIVEFAYGATVVIVLLMSYSGRDFQIFIRAMDAALIVSSFICVYFLWDFLVTGISIKAIRDVASYTLPVFISGCGGAVLQSAAPLILAAHLSPKEVGYFGAYEMGSVGVTSVLFQIVYAVLAPLASVPERQPGAWKKFLLILLPLAAGVFIAFLLGVLLILELFGRGYPVVYSWVSLFSAAAVAQFLFFCALSLLVVRDVAGAWEGTGGTLITAVACLLGSLWAIPVFGFSGAAIALILGYGAGLLWCVFWGLRHLRKSSLTNNAA